MLPVSKTDNTFVLSNSNKLVMQHLSSCTEIVWTCGSSETLFATKSSQSKMVLSITDNKEMCIHCQTTLVSGILNTSIILLKGYAAFACPFRVDLSRLATGLAKETLNGFVFYLVCW